MLMKAKPQYNKDINSPDYSIYSMGFHSKLQLFFMTLRELIFKIHMEGQRAENKHQNIEKKKDGRFSLLDIKSYYYAVRQCNISQG